MILGPGAHAYAVGRDPNRPTYRPITSGQVPLVPADMNRLTVAKNGGINETIAAIITATRASLPQTAELARWLQAPNLKQTAYNIWHFLKTNVRYTKDPNGFEKVRLASRSWADRKTGIDCEDASIFIASVLTNLGYRPKFRIVKTNNARNWEHIFVTVAQGNQEFTVDFVMDLFDKAPDNITTTMTIDLLSGDTSTSMDGLGYTTASRSTGRAVRRSQNRLPAFYNQLTARINRLPVAQRPAKQRVLHWIKALGRRSQAQLLGKLFDFIADVQPNGQLMVRAEHVNLVGKYAALHFEKRQARVRRRTLGADSDYNALAGAEWAVNARLANGDIAGAEAEIGSVFKKIGKGLKTAARFALLKANPALILARNSFLLLVRINAFNLANKLRIAYLTPEQQRQANIDQRTADSIGKFKRTVEKVFYSVGGEKKNLRKAVVAGSKKFMRKNGLSGDELMGIAGMELEGTDVELNAVNYEATFNGLAGIGAAPAAAAVASAAPIVAKFAAIFGKFAPIIAKVGKGLKAAKGGVSLVRKIRARKKKRALSGDDGIGKGFFRRLRDRINSKVLEKTGINIQSKKRAQQIATENAKAIERGADPTTLPQITNRKFLASQGQNTQSFNPSALLSTLSKTPPAGTNTGFPPALETGTGVPPPAEPPKSGLSKNVWLIGGVALLGVGAWVFLK